MAWWEPEDSYRGEGGRRDTEGADTTPHSYPGREHILFFPFWPTANFQEGVPAAEDSTRGSPNAAAADNQRATLEAHPGNGQARPTPATLALELGPWSRAFT